MIIWLYKKHKILVSAGSTFIAHKVILGFRSSFICQGTSTRRQRSDLCGLRVKSR